MLRPIPVVPSLSIRGQCRECGSIVDCHNHGRILADHKDSSGVKCKGSGFRPLNPDYVIDTPEEALAVAEFLKTYDGRCFHSHMGEHSLACGHGEVCYSDHRRIAKAMAEYYEAMVIIQEPID